MAKQKNKVRIIAGQLGSRTLTFLEAEGLRPTLDRVRETLFNWLQADIINANCLDLFSGSGALAFEAISRGAKQVTAVEKNHKVAQQLKENSKLLKLKNLEIKQQAAEQFIKQSKTAFDVIFVDPPFAMQARESMPLLLENSSLIHDKTLVYLECSAQQSYILPSNWGVVKEKKMGDVRFQLVQRIS